jgi:hypothetical protein
MFKRAKRALEILERLLAIEEDCLEIVKRRDRAWRVLEAREAHRALEDAKPFKCPFAGCAVDQPHAHTIEVTSSAKGKEHD